jgi:hypothetical protein
MPHLELGSRRIGYQIRPNILNNKKCAGIVAERFIVVSDESGVDGSNRFQSLAFVSGPERVMVEFNKICKRILGDHGVSELKWNEIAAGHKNRAAREAIKEFFKHKDLKVLVLCWDTQDSRHNVCKRDDIENFHRMIYHGLRRNADWLGPKEWHWFPDQRTNLNAEIVATYLNVTRENKLDKTTIPLIDLYRDLHNFKSVRQKCSKVVPVIGVADLFAGVVRESALSGGAMVKALANLHNQANQSLFADDFSHDLGSKGEKARAEFGAYIHYLGAGGQHGISLRSEGKLITKNNEGRFFFWHYEPQGEYDKAPVKSRF